MCKALFLDRDGVINVEKDYVYKIQDFEFMEGIFDLCRIAQMRGLLIVIITNQAGIGRGYYGEADFHALSDWMLSRFKEQGIEIAGVYFCPDHPEHGLGKYKRESECRKPNPGMILEACLDFQIDLSASFLLGDKESDVQAGKTAGVGSNFLLLSERATSRETCANRVFNSVGDVSDWLKSVS